MNALLFSIHMAKKSVAEALARIYIAAFEHDKSFQFIFSLQTQDSASTTLVRLLGFRIERRDYEFLVAHSINRPTLVLG